MKQVILSLAHRGSNYMASLWNLEQSEVYGTYKYANGRLTDVTHQTHSSTEEGLARYSPAWLIQAESFIHAYLNEQSELGSTHRSINKWLVTVHIDVLADGLPEDPLAPIVSMQPHLN